MRRLVVFLVFVTLASVACGGGDGGAPKVPFEGATISEAVLGGGVVWEWSTPTTRRSGVRWFLIDVGASEEAPTS